MEKLIENIKAAIEAGKAGDNTKLGTSIVGIIENAAGLIGKIFGL
ncbi:beta-class phenol-soluble modulin [Staphylococcus sp. HKU1]